MTLPDSLPCYWRPTFIYDEGADGLLTPRWSDLWYLVDPNGEPVSDSGKLIQRHMPPPEWPLPDVAWEDERVRRPA